MGEPEAYEMKAEDRPLADPSLPRAARLALVLFCLAVLAAFVWALWLLWTSARHSIWPATILCGAYGAWLLWFKRHSLRGGRKGNQAGSGKISHSENSN